MTSDDLNIFSVDVIKEYLARKLSLIKDDKNIKGIYINRGEVERKQINKEILYNSYLDFIKKFSTSIQSVLGTITYSDEEREEMTRGTEGQGGHSGYHAYKQYLDEISVEIPLLNTLTYKMDNYVNTLPYQQNCVKSFVGSILYGMPNEVFLQPFLNKSYEICRGCGSLEGSTDECDECEEGYTRCERECDDGTIYCQSCENGYIECEECDNDGEVECGECDGAGTLPCPQENLGVCQEGEVECEECNGTGKKDNGEECDECDGRGKTTCEECDGDETVNCPYCDDGYNACDECGGDGNYECNECEYQGYSYCQDCDNDGYNTCEVCNGEWEATNCQSHEVVNFVPQQLKPFVDYINRPDRILNKVKIKVEMVNGYENWVKKLNSINGKHILAIGIGLQKWDNSQSGDEIDLTMKCQVRAVNFEEPLNNYIVGLGFNKNNDDYKGYIHHFYHPIASYNDRFASDKFLILTIPYGISQGFMNWDVFPF